MRWSYIVSAFFIAAVIAFWIFVPAHKKSPPKITLDAFVITSSKVAAAPRVDDCRVPERSEVREAESALLAPGTTVRQNDLANAYRLHRVVDLDDLRARIDAGALVPLTDTSTYRFGDGFAEADPGNRTLYAHALPHVRPFLDDLLGEAYRCFGEDLRRADESRIARAKAERETFVAKLSKRRDKKARRMLAELRPLDLEPKFDRFTIDSLTRTEKYQARLVRNGKWPAARGDTPETRTTHTTGATIDIGLTMVPPHIRDWLRVRLARLEREGRIDVVEERGRSTICAHIMVIPSPGTVQAAMAAGE